MVQSAFALKVGNGDDKVIAGVELFLKADNISYSHKISHDSQGSAPRIQARQQECSKQERKTPLLETIRIQILRYV
jgi:hypothetical protein